MAKQGAKDRAMRLNKGCCPVHGIEMPQIGSVGEELAERFLVECPRKDCKIRGTSSEPFGLVELEPDFAFLIGPRAI